MRLGQKEIKPLIRNARTTDLSAIAEVSKSTSMFLGEELDNFMGMLEAHFDPPTADAPDGANLIVATDGEGDDAPVVGAAYFMPEPMAQGVMNLLFIGVLPSTRKRGIGKALLGAFEAEVVSTKARLAIIETASDAMFAPAWALYRGAGYSEEARIRDYYEDGLDKLVFRKRP